MTHYNCTAKLSTTIIRRDPVQVAKLWMYVRHFPGDVTEEEAKLRLVQDEDRLLEMFRDPTTEVAKHLKYIVFQLERGPKNGNFHYQGYFEFVGKPRPVSWMKHMFIVEWADYGSVFFTPKPENNVLHCHAYCTKDRDRVPGTVPVEIINRGVEALE